MRSVIRVILERLALGLLTLLIVSIFIFSAIEFLPGDFAQSILGQSATPETVAAFQKEIGLDRPATVRYIEWISGVIHGDFGSSFASRSGVRRSVAEVIGPRLSNTLFLAGTTAMIAVPLALLLGVLSALYRDSWFDRSINSATLIAISFPEFFVAYILMLFLAVKFPIFHSLASINSEMGVVESLNRIALPVFTLSLVIAAHMMRMTRNAIIGLLNSPYVEMAQLKGVSPSRIIIGHVLPNAWAPIANVVAFNLAYLIVGVVVVEVVFVYPGIGQSTVDAVRSRDIPIVQACALIFASTYILLNLIADIVAIATNPRLMHPR